MEVGELLEFLKSFSDDASVYIDIIDDYTNDLEVRKGVKNCKDAVLTPTKGKIL